jgi:hypothetical protein
MTERLCSHAKTFKTRCIECELVSAREALASARDNVNLYGKLIAKLEAEQQLSALLP